MVATEIVIEKTVGAILLFIVTFCVTLLPYVFKNVHENKLKIVKCFCGGVSSYYQGVRVILLKL